MIALKLRNISKYYTSQTAVVMGLSEVNLSFSTGEFVAVTGENGSGKSTLANVIGGILPYESGELFIMGQPTSHYDAADWERYRRDLISFISQDYGILPGNTVFENVESALLLSGSDRAEAREKTREILEKVELSEYAKRRAAKLSSGQKQRLAIARALAKPSRILIADEPTGNLDRENSDKVIRLLKEASEERLVILITHEFAEAEPYITRHVVLSDGKVIKDTECAPKKTDDGACEHPARRRAEGRGLGPYIARLTGKARPAFFIFTTLILVLTCLGAFIFLGNFMTAADDVTSRLYDPSAFRNGDQTRIVLVKDGMLPFTDEELSEIAGEGHVRFAEKYGYISDVNYYYREDIDYRKYKSADFGENYDPLENTDDYTYSVKVKLLDGSLFVKSVTCAGAVKNGRMAEGFYEVLSADPNVKAGTRIVVFIKDRAHWAIPEYLRIVFDVVGETSGTGLYFSESFCRMLNNATANAIYRSADSYAYYPGGDLGRYPVAPYEYERFKGVMVSDPPSVSDEEADAPDLPSIMPIEPTPEPTPIPIPEELEDDECVYPMASGYSAKIVGSDLRLSIGDLHYSGGYHTPDGDSKDYMLICAGLFNSTHTRFTLVNQRIFDEMTASLTSNQVSVFIDDYAYSQRVINRFVSKGYAAVSPYAQGSTQKDPVRETERINLLRISLAAAVLTFVLQLILLKVTFSSLKDQYKLLSNMGLRGRTAYASLALLFAALTVLSQLIAAAVILVLNHYGWQRIVNIFKYLNTAQLLLIFAVHLLFSALAYLIVVRSIKKQVFSINGHDEDIDGELMEEVLGE